MNNSNVNFQQSASVWQPGPMYTTRSGFGTREG